MQILTNVVVWMRWEKHFPWQFVYIFQITGMEKKVKRLKIVFSESTDFYGRITVYCLDIVGKTWSEFKGSAAGGFPCSQSVGVPGKGVLWRM